MRADFSERTKRAGAVPIRKVQENKREGRTRSRLAGLREDGGKTSARSVIDEPLSARQQITPVVAHRAEIARCEVAAVGFFREREAAEFARADQAGQSLLLRFDSSQPHRNRTQKRLAECDGRSQVAPRDHPQHPRALFKDASAPPSSFGIK